MGCCGKGASIKGSKNQAFASGAISSEVSMEDSTLVQYVGRKSIGSTFNVYGFATATQYRVRVGTPFYVSNQDLISSIKGQGILQKYEGNNFAYVQVDVPVVPEVVEPEELVVDDAGVETVQEFDYSGLEALVQTGFTDAETPYLETETELDWSFLDSNLTIVKTTLHKGGYTKDELNLLLAYELSNKNRSGAVSAIEEELLELLDSE